MSDADRRGGRRLRAHARTRGRTRARCRRRPSTRLVGGLRPRTRAGPSPIGRDFGAALPPTPTRWSPGGRRCGRGLQPDGRASWPGRARGRGTAGTCSARSRSPRRSRTRRAMVEACHEAGVQLHTAFVSRFLPLVQKAKARSTAGELGDLIGLGRGNRGRPPLPPHYPAWITDAERSRWRGADRPLRARHRCDAPHERPGGQPRLGRGRRAAVGLRRRRHCAAVAGVRRWRRRAASTRAGRCRRATRGTTTSSCGWSGPKGSFDLNDLAESRAAGEPEWRWRRLRLAGFADDADAAMIEAFAASVARRRAC